MVEMKGSGDCGGVGHLLVVAEHGEVSPQLCGRAQAGTAQVGDDGGDEGQEDRAGQHPHYHSVASDW